MNGVFQQNHLFAFDPSTRAPGLAGDDPESRNFKDFWIPALRRSLS